MGERYKQWTQDPRTKGVITGYGLDGLDDSQQEIFEKTVLMYRKTDFSSDSEKYQLRKRLGDSLGRSVQSLTNPIMAIAVAIEGIGEVSSADPQQYLADSHHRGLSHPQHRG
jgi:hypothetical protein